jgi:hypothetical protein
VEIAIACGLYFVTDPQWQSGSLFLRMLELGGFLITLALAAMMIRTMRVSKPMLYWQRWLPMAGLGIPAALTFLILNLINFKDRVIDQEDIVQGMRGGATNILVHAAACTIIAAIVQPKMTEETVLPDKE